MHEVIFNGPCFCGSAQNIVILSEENSEFASLNKSAAASVTSVKDHNEKPQFVVLNEELLTEVDQM